MNISISKSQDVSRELSLWMLDQGIKPMSREMGDVMMSRRKFATGEIRGWVYTFGEKAVAFVRTPACTLRLNGGASDVDRAATQAVKHGRRQMALAYLYAQQHESAEVAA